MLCRWTIDAYSAWIRCCWKLSQLQAGSVLLVQAAKADAQRGKLQLPELQAVWQKREAVMGMTLQPVV